MESEKSDSMAKTNQEFFESSYNENLSKIKHYIKTAKDAKNHLRREKNERTYEPRGIQNIFLDFSLKCIIDKIDSLQIEFENDLAQLSDEEITRLSNNQSNQLIVFDQVSKGISELLESATSTPSKQIEIDNVVKRFEELGQSRTEYVMKLKIELEEREIEKNNNFKESLLSIKLSKFSDFNSPYDIYTFQTKFEKLYLKSTPRSMIPELLKNNYLEDPALSLVKSVNNIDEIWARLKRAYGDPKIMLTKKLNEIEQLEFIWRKRSPVKIAEALTKILNVLKDLMHLAKEHRIENRLYNSDALDKIYRIIGDERVTKWLVNIYNKDYEGEELWNRLIDHIEKDVNIQQQKILINENNQKKDFKTPDRPPKSNIHFSVKNSSKNEKPNNLVCSICGEEDHIPTAGPWGSKVIQYFTCKKFVEMTPLDRFQALRKKGLCFQCLFPGAERNKGKHSEGKCQRDFVCKYSAHDKFPTKKHVLVCAEHKDQEENKKLLEEYKNKCILKPRDIEMSDFAKTIKLSFHTEKLKIINHPFPTPSLANVNIKSSVSDTAIFLLQTIKVDNYKYTIFFDSGCGDFVSRYEAVCLLRSHAHQEHPGPVKIGGVGGVTTISKHGIYKVSIPLSNGELATMSGVCLDKITTTFPTYPLQGQVLNDFLDAYKDAGDIKVLPKIPKSVGGVNKWL